MPALRFCCSVVCFAFSSVSDFSSCCCQVRVFARFVTIVKRASVIYVLFGFWHRFCVHTLERLSLLLFLSHSLPSRQPLLLDIAILCTLAALPYRTEYLYPLYIAILPQWTAAEWQIAQEGKNASKACPLFSPSIIAIKNNKTSTRRQCYRRNT